MPELLQLTHFRTRLFGSLAFLLLFFSSSSVGLHGQNPEIRIEASFSPPSITLSNNCIYKVVLHGTQDTPQGSLPGVSGLTISNSPQVFRSASFINGTPSVRLEMSFQARPQREGSFTLPAWDLKVNGKTLRVPAAVLQVLPYSQQDVIRKQQEKLQQQQLKEAAFIEFDTLRPFLFEGETVPVTIKLFLWDRLPVTRIEQAPTKSGDSFSITELGQPNEQRNFTRNGKTYTVFSWPIGLTAAMAGDHRLNFKTAIRVRVNNRRSSPFGSPFLNDPFFGIGREESLLVGGSEKIIEVRSLPMKGRPLGFQGAIGSFTAESYLDSDRVSLGDPVKLTFEISGTGNFSAVPAPEIKSNEKIKVGPPAFSFLGNETTKHEGKQSFEFIVTPLTAGLVEIPSIEFSFFDPLEETFLSSQTHVHPLRVDPGEKWISGETENKAPNERLNFVTRSTADLFQTESEPGEWADSLERKPLHENHLFWYLQSVPLFGFCIMTFLGINKRRDGKQKFRQKQNSLHRQMKDAVGFNDSSSLLRSFRDLLRLKLAKLHGHPNPSSLASEEIITLLRKGKNSNDLIEDVQEMLKNCDDQEFAGSELTKQPLDSLYRKGSVLLRNLR